MMRRLVGPLLAFGVLLLMSDPTFAGWLTGVGIGLLVVGTLVVVAAVIVASPVVAVAVVGAGVATIVVGDILIGVDTFSSTAPSPPPAAAQPAVAALPEPPVLLDPSLQNPTFQHLPMPGNAADTVTSDLNGIIDAANGLASAVNNDNNVQVYAGL